MTEEEKIALEKRDYKLGLKELSLRFARDVGVSNEKTAERFIEEAKLILKYLEED